MDYEAIEAWLFMVENYFAVVGLTDKIKQSRFASTLLTNNAALWQYSSHLNLNITKFPTLKYELLRTVDPPTTGVKHTTTWLTSSSRVV